MSINSQKNYSSCQRRHDNAVEDAWWERIDDELEQERVRNNEENEDGYLSTREDVIL